MSRIDNVSVVRKANIYFDGKCVSHTLLYPDGTRKSIGVIFPGALTFNTGVPELMEITGGRCRVRLAGQSAWESYGAGQEFRVPGHSSFDIEVTETVDYLCHYA